MGVKIADTESHTTANVQNAQIVRLVLNSGGLLLPANSILYPFGIIPRLSIILDLNLKFNFSLLQNRDRYELMLLI